MVISMLKSIFYHNKRYPENPQDVENQRRETSEGLKITFHNRKKENSKVGRMRSMGRNIHITGMSGKTPATKPQRRQQCSGFILYSLNFWTFHTFPPKMSSDRGQQNLFAYYKLNLLLNLDRTKNRGVKERCLRVLALWEGESEDNQMSCLWTIVTEPDLAVHLFDTLLLSFTTALSASTIISLSRACI